MRRQFLDEKEIRTQLWARKGIIEIMEDMAIIVIPIYREMTKSERISFIQVRRILNKYPLCFMAPERMRSFFIGKDYRVEYFPDVSMSSIQDYSKLLLTSEFYQRFINYQYILLYQLDAFVFSDQLERFCAMDYDYIGAPVPFSFWGSTFKIKGLHMVENGGFSLRKTSSCLRMTLMRDTIYTKTNRQAEFERAEDVFFSYCGNMKDIDFRIPHTSVALTFSTTFNVGHGLDRIKCGHLPFGCHAWSKLEFFDFWRPFIQLFFYKEALNEVAEEVYSKAVAKTYGYFLAPIVRYLIRRIMREGKRTKVNKILQGLFMDPTKPIIIWGYGVQGQRSVRLFAFARVPVGCVFEKNQKIDTHICAIPIIYPDEEIIKSKQYTIIISTSKYYSEIFRTLDSFGLKENDDFYSYMEIERTVAISYYLPIWNQYKSI